MLQINVRKSLLLCESASKIRDMGSDTDNIRTWQDELLGEQKASQECQLTSRFARLPYLDVQEHSAGNWIAGGTERGENMQENWLQVKHASTVWTMLMMPYQMQRLCSIKSDVRIAIHDVSARTSDFLVKDDSLWHSIVHINVKWVSPTHYCSRTRSFGTSLIQSANTGNDPEWVTSTSHVHNPFHVLSFPFLVLQVKVFREVWQPQAIID